MRRYIANDRRIANEVTAANVDAPERATYVVTDTTPTSPTDLEVGCDAGTVVIDGTEVSVTAQTASVSDISGQVTETAYRYHTLSVDATGSLVVRSSGVGEFDAANPDAEPITQVTEPEHQTGEVFIGTAFQVDAAVERVFDGRYVLDGVPNSVITQGQGSGLDADTLRGKTNDDIVPQGVIVMWSGSVANIPSDWTLCDGTDGTPDLRDRFVTGAGGQYAVGDTGGEDEHTLTEAEMPSHSHGPSGGGSFFKYPGNNYDVNYEQGIGEFGLVGTTDTSGGDQPHENRPPYYALAFIMKI